MKNSYFAKTLSIGFFLIIFLSGGEILAQNNSFLDFDGSNDYVKYSDDATLGRMDGATDYTIEAWIFPVDGRVAEYDRVLQRYYSFAIVMYDGNNDGNVEDWYFQVYDKASSSWKYYNTEGDATLTLDAWNHIAVINNSSEDSLKLYVNGVNVTQTGGYASRSLPSSSSNDNLYIGQKGNGASYFGGYIDEVRLKNTAEDKDDLHHNIYDNEYSSDANTAGLFHFNEGSGTTTKNETSGTNATINNGAVWRLWSYNSTNHLPLSYEWKGSTDTDWGTSGNWEGGVPTSANDVLIPTGLTNYPSVSGSISSPSQCNNLKIESGASLTVPVDKALTVNGEVTNNAGTSGLVISSNSTNKNGSFIFSSGTPDATVQRYIGAYSGDNDGWHEIGAPVDMTVSGSGFDPGTNDDLYYWDESSNEWKNYKAGSFNFTQGNGYLLAYQTSATKNFTGTLTASDITYSNLSYTTGSGRQGFHLLGNPYSSAILWNNGGWTFTNVGTVCSVWDESSGTYINPSNGDPIPATNGFFVEVTDASNTLTIPASARSHNSNANYKNSTKNLLIAKITNDVNTYNNTIKVGFKEDASVQWDQKYDAHKLYGVETAPELWTISDNGKFAVNILPFSNQPYDIPMHFKAGVDDANYTITFDGISGFNEGTNIVLEDKFTGTSIDLNVQNKYTFTGKTGDNPDRFVLHFYNVTGIKDIDQTAKPATIYANNNYIIIKSAKGNLNGTVEVLNLLGQMVYSSEIYNTGFLKLNNRFDNGVYIVRYRGDNGTVQSGKVVLQ